MTDGLDIYTIIQKQHVESGDVKKYFFTFMNVSNYDLCSYNRIPDVVTPNVDFDIEEGEVDMEEAADDE